jgi:hypothetical protein
MTAKPAVYFHKLGTTQDEDRLVYEDQEPPHAPAHRTGRGRSLPRHHARWTRYEKNGVELLDLRKPGAACQPLAGLGRALHLHQVRVVMSFISTPPQGAASAR